MAMSGSFEPGTRPRPARDIATLTGVKSVTACRYALGGLGETSDARPPAPLFSSLRLIGGPAQDVAAAMAAAPPGGGPDEPEACLADFSYGDEMIIAHIESDQGQSTVHVYYSGCDHNGLDDGIAVRALTRPAVQPLIAAANQPLMWSGPDAKRRILNPDQ
jgi:hypothetical protein